jgi:hypothetical protein
VLSSSSLLPFGGDMAMVELKNNVGDDDDDDPPVSSSESSFNGREKGTIGIVILFSRLVFVVVVFVAVDDDDVVELQLKRLCFRRCVLVVIGSSLCIPRRFKRRERII